MKYLISIVVVVLLGSNCIGQQQRKDTIKVIMQVCDTSHSNYVEKTQKIWWQFGHEIKEWQSTAMGVYYHEPIYLDQNKKPLPKSIVVWQTKEIK